MSNMKERLADIEEQKLQEMADKIEKQIEEDEQLAEVLEQAVKDYDNEVAASRNRGLIYGTLLTALVFFILSR